jgi:hypothetical protein
MLRKYYFFFVLLFVLQILLLHTTGCKKEYSYEGGDTTIIKKDSIIILPPVIGFPLCSLCKVNDPVLEGKWNFKTGNSYLCGIIDNGIITGDKNAFTFFGPSACSIDSGIVMTVYLDPIRLDADMFNVTTNKVAFYYYDHNATSYIFISQSTVNFSLTLDSYIYATGIASGTFSGGVFKANGETAFIREGKFKVKLK